MPPYLKCQPSLHGAADFVQSNCLFSIILIRCQNTADCFSKSLKLKRLPKKCIRKFGMFVRQNPSLIIATGQNHRDIRRNFTQSSQGIPAVHARHRQIREDAADLILMQLEYFYGLNPLYESMTNLKFNLILNNLLAVNPFAVKRHPVRPTSDPAHITISRLKYCSPGIGGEHHRNNFGKRSGFRGLLPATGI